MKRVAIYMRVSTDKQAKEGDSIPAQREALERYAKDHHYILVDEYLDDGISGTKADRSEYQRMLSDVQAGRIDLILCCKMDRLHRSLRNFLNMQNILDKNHCDWLAIWEPMYDSSTPQGRMIINTMVNLAQFEAEQTGQRIRQVFEYKRAKGEVLNGNSPYGFRVESKRLVPDENAEKVREIFEKYAETGNLYQTCNFAASLGYARNRSTLKHMLRMPAYKEIVGTEVFEAVQRYLPVNVKCSAKRVYIFTGLIKCECGTRMTGFAQKQSLMYRCPKHYAALKACDNQHSISQAKLERYLLDHMQELLADYIAKQEAQTGKPKDNSRKIKALEKKIDRLKDLYVEELITLEEYKADKEKYLTEIASLQSAPQPVQNAQKQLLEMDLESYYTNLTQEQKRGFWRSIIKEITFDKDRHITVFFL